MSKPTDKEMKILEERAKELAEKSGEDTYIVEDTETGEFFVVLESEIEDSEKDEGKNNVIH